ncbi:MAG: carboxypeptidase-like regulatory domain-containing protein, partial [Chloroflexi bacterium]|nr:carboxypeptidase-like regulatory domain-containing protein [Chloroflexota bacterium]
NEISINIVDAESGAPSPNALVRIEDSFGQQVATDSADDSGAVSFAGIRPGKKRVTIRKVDYQIARASIEVPQSGEAAVEVALQKSPGKRLLFYAYGLSDTGETTVVGIDRASGLPTRETILIPHGRFAPASVPSWNLYQGFFLAVEGDSGTTGAESLSALWAMGAAARQLRTATSGFSFGAWHTYLGKSSLGDIVHTFWSRQVPVGTTHLCVVDPKSGHIVRRERIAHNVLPPILSSDGSKAFLVNWDKRSVDVLELATGDRTTIVEDIPLLIAEAAGNPADDEDLILSTADGSVYKLHMPTGELTEIYPDDQLQSVVNAGDDGRLMTSVFHSHDLVVSSLETGQIEAVIPLESHINWLFRDRSGPYIFAAHLNWPAVIKVQIIDSDNLRIVDVVEIPNVNDAMRQDGLLPEDS